MSALSEWIEEAVQRAVFLSVPLATEYRQIAIEIAPNLAPLAVERLNRHVSGFVILPTAEELTEFLALHDVRARQIQAAGLVIIGFYQAVERRILLSAEPWQTDFSPETRKRNLAHALGHAIDGPAREFSTPVEWQSVFGGTWRKEG